MAQEIGMEVVALGGTRAMMAANALRKAAKEQNDAAASLGEYPTAASNCRTLGEWYVEAARALEALDARGTVIVREEAA